MLERKVFSKHEIKKENVLDDEQTKVGITGHEMCHAETGWCSSKTPGFYLRSYLVQILVGTRPSPSREISG